MRKTNRRNPHARWHDQRALAQLPHPPRPSGARHKFMERADSELCHLCWMPRSHPDHDAQEVEL